MLSECLVSDRRHDSASAQIGYTPAPRLSAVSRISVKSAIA